MNKNRDQNEKCYHEIPNKLTYCLKTMQLLFKNVLKNLKKLIHRISVQICYLKY